MVDELWKKVTGFPSYEVSSLGRVRSVNKMLSPRKSKQGYLGVQLYNKPYCRQVQVHTLVMEEFIGPRPNGHVVHHKDENKTNNGLDNLTYVTYSENSRLSSKRGENHPQCLYTDEEVHSMKSAIDSGEAWTSVSRRFDCGVGYMSTLFKLRLAS